MFEQKDERIRTVLVIKVCVVVIGIMYLSLDKSRNLSVKNKLKGTEKEEYKTYADMEQLYYQMKCPSMWKR